VSDASQHTLTRHFLGPATRPTLCQKLELLCTCHEDSASWYRLFRKWNYPRNPKSPNDTRCNQIVDSDQILPIAAAKTRAKHSIPQSQDRQILGTACAAMPESWAPQWNSSPSKCVIRVDLYEYYFVLIDVWFIWFIQLLVPFRLQSMHHYAGRHLCDWPLEMISNPCLCSSLWAMRKETGRNQCTMNTPWICLDDVAQVLAFYEPDRLDFISSSCSRSPQSYLSFATWKCVKTVCTSLSIETRCICKVVIMTSFRSAFSNRRPRYLLWWSLMYPLAYLRPNDIILPSGRLL